MHAVSFFQTLISHFIARSRRLCGEVPHLMRVYGLVGFVVNAGKTGSMHSLEHRQITHPLPKFTPSLFEEGGITDGIFP
jgi:hypothetical protein